MGIIENWNHEGERAWFRRAWAILRAAGLTYYLDDSSKCIVLTRGLALARLLRSFQCRLDDSWSPSEYTFTLTDFGIESEKEGALTRFYGYEEYGELLCQEYSVVKDAIRKKMNNDDSELFLFFYKSRFPSGHKIDKYNVLNCDVFEKMRAFDWINSGCEYL